MKRYRCFACDDGDGRPGRDFESDVARCPTCKLDRSHPRAGELLIDLVDVHFDPPSGVRGVGRNHPACDPRRAAAAPDVRLTGAAPAVTCPACRRTPVWAAASGGGGAATAELATVASSQPAAIGADVEAVSTSASESPTTIGRGAA